MEKLKKLKTFTCWVENFYEGQPLESDHVAVSYSQARYAFWQEHQDSLVPFGKCQKFIKIKSLGSIQPSHFFGDKEMFGRMCKYRGIEFAYQGMVVDVAGKRGWLVGANSHMNLDVLFEGNRHPSNCHPTWETTYLDNKNNIIQNFKKAVA